MPGYHIIPSSVYILYSRLEVKPKIYPSQTAAVKVKLTRGARMCTQHALISRGDCRTNCPHPSDYKESLLDRDGVLFYNPSTAIPNNELLYDIQSYDQCLYMSICARAHVLLYELLRILTCLLRPFHP